MSKGIYIPNMDAEEFDKLCAENGLQFVYIIVPEHGRLGDLDKMLADNEIYYNQLGRPEGEVGARYQSVKRSIELAPTVIEAECENDC